MADRDFNIPMGPDRTGSIDLEPIDFGDGSTADDATLKSYFSDSLQQNDAYGQYQETSPIDVAPAEASVAPMGDDDFLPKHDDGYESYTVSSEQARG